MAAWEMNVPVPPEYYWNSFPWWGYVGFSLMALLIVVVVGPYMTQWARGKPSALVSREQAVALQAAEINRLREQTLQDYRDREALAHTNLAKERDEWEKERDRLERDRDEGWDRGRGMEELAHVIGHQYQNLTERFNALVLILRRIAEGTIMLEKVSALSEQVLPVEPMKPIPKLRDVERRRF
jgi:hypothetical protein